ncbi:MAG: family 16 glycosylhydrolase, partial [Isosphaeraceae bacterium]
GGWSTCVLSWSSPALAKQVIPSAALSPSSSLAPSPPKSGPPSDGPWRLLFDENFDTLDPNLWVNRYWWNGNLGTQATFDPSGVSVSDGVLSLTARREARTSLDGVNTPYTSGLISTGGIEGVRSPGFAFRYGYVETRSKIAPGWGMWSALWMLPVSRNDGLAEIDLFENLGRRPDVFNGFYHRADRGVHFESKVPTEFDLSADWHTYGLDWRADRLSWYFDGVEVARYTVAAEIVAEPMYLILNLDVGGAWAGPVSVNTPSRSSLQVDYVKVWQR